MIQYSIGELIDKLCIVHLKLWHTEESIQQLTKDQADIKEIEILCDRIREFNTLRNDLVDSINEFFKERDNNG